MRSCFFLICYICTYSFNINAQNKSINIDYELYSKVCDGIALQNTCTYNSDSAFHKILLLEPNNLVKHEWKGSAWNNKLPVYARPKDISEVVFVGCISKEAIWKSCDYEQNHQLVIFEGEKVKIDVYFASTGILYMSKTFEKNTGKDCPPKYEFSYDEAQKALYTATTIDYDKDIKEWIDDAIGEGIVITNTVVDITENSAICKAEILRNTSSSLTKIGICWSTSPQPKITGLKSEFSPITGEYFGKLTGLRNNVKYYVRAYAVNSKGIVYYGNELSFIAKKTFNTFLDIRDNHVYKYIKIGDQIIMSENFAFKPDSGSFWALNNDEQNIIKYGYLYNWETAQKVIPKGWHVPTQKEWLRLYKYLGDNYNKVFNALQNLSPNFNPLLCGYRKPDGEFVDLGVSTNYWSSSCEEDGKAWYFYYDDMYKIANLSKISKEYGCSLRLFHD